MKIYGYTVVDSEGYGDGSESFTRLFKSKEERDSMMLADYMQNLADLSDYGNVIIDADEISYDGITVIQLDESHVQYEPFCEEL